MSGENQNPLEPQKSNKLKWLIPGGLFLIFLAGIIFSYRQHPGGTPRELPQLSQERLNNAGAAPDFEVSDLNGAKVRLKDFRGKAVLVNFWSITCPACLMEMKSLESLSQQLSGKPFALVAITSDDSDQVRQFLDKTGSKIPAYFDYKSEAHQKYGAYYLPASFVIDPEGRLVDQFAGAADWSNPSVISYFQKLIELYQPNKPAP